MVFSAGDRVRLIGGKRIGRVQHSAGAQGIVVSVPRSGTVRVRMEGTGAEGNVRQSEVTIERNVVTSRSADWIVTRASQARPTLRGSVRTDLPDIPPFIQDGRFEVVEEVEARESPRAAGLRSAVPAPLQIEVPGQTSDAYIAVARHPSGALTFHRPEQPPGIVVRGALRTAPRSGPVVFSILVGPPAPSEAADGFAVRGILGRIVKVVVMKVVNFVAGQAVEVLGRKLEE